MKLSSVYTVNMISVRKEASSIKFLHFSILYAQKKQERLKHNTIAY